MNPIQPEWEIKLQKLLIDFSNGIYYELDPTRYNGTDQMQIIEFVRQELDKAEQEGRQMMVEVIEAMIDKLRYIENVNKPKKEIEK